MLSARPISNQRHVTYKKREVPIYNPIENTLMDEHGLTYSDLCKFSNREKLTEYLKKKTYELGK